MPFLRKIFFFLFFITAVCVFYAQPQLSADELPPSQNYGYYPASMDISKQELLNSSVENLVNDSVRHLRNKEVVKATAVLWGAITLSPNDYRAYEGLANIFWNYRQYSKLYRLLERALRYYVDADYLLPKLIKQYMEKPGVFRPVDRAYIAPFKNDYIAAYSFMFDDGQRDVATHIIPIFKEYGLTATIPINPGETYEGDKNKWRGNWEQWKDAAESGFEIANHTWSHQTIVGASEEQLHQQITKSYDLIEEKLGAASESFIFPLNESDKPSIEYASRRHFALRTPEIMEALHEQVFMPVYGGEFFSVDTANLIVDWAIHQGMWIVPVCHGMVVEEVKSSYKPVTEDFLRKHLDYIKEYENEVWVATFLDVYSYLYARKHAELQVEKESDNDITLNILRKPGSKDVNVPLTIVVDPKKAITEVKVFTVKSRERLPARIRNGIIFIDSPFEDRKIKVSWK